MQKIKNIENRIFYIYTLKCPLTMKIKYVGVTCTKLNARLSQHIYDSKKGGTYKRNWIQSLLKIDLKPIIEVIETCSYLNWEEREKYWINSYSNLTNTKEGGNGVILNRSFDSIKRSSEAKFKSIIGIDSNRNIQLFNSLKEAQIITGVPRTSIQYSLSQINNSSYGYNFLYKEEYYEGLENIVKINPRKYKYKIKHLDKTYTPIEFAKKLNISETIVYLWCEGKSEWKNSRNFDGNEINIIKI